MKRDLFPGVYAAGGGYKAYPNLTGEGLTYLGTFPTPEEAEEEIKRAEKEYKENDGVFITSLYSGDGKHIVNRGGGYRTPKAEVRQVPKTIYFK